MQVTSADTVKAPIDRVFAVFSDVASCGDRIAGITALEVLSDVQSGLSVKWRETRTMFGKEATEEMWMSGFDAPNSYQVEAESHGTHYLTTFTFKAIDDNTTKVPWIFEGKALSLMAKLMVPLAALFKGTTLKRMSADITDLKNHVEGQD